MGVVPVDVRRGHLRAMTGHTAKNEGSSGFNSA